MDLRHNIIFVIGVVFLSVGVTDAIQCYECATMESSNCGDPFNPAGVNKCYGNSCIKVWASGSSRTVVTRGCHPETNPKDECVDVSASGGKGKACACKSNLCNGGGKLQPNYMHAVLLGLATAILRTINVF